MAVFIPVEHLVLPCQDIQRMCNGGWVAGSSIVLKLLAKRDQLENRRIVNGEDLLTGPLTTPVIGLFPP